MPDLITNVFFSFGSFSVPLQPFAASSDYPSTQDPTTRILDATSAQATATSFQEFYEALEEELNDSSTAANKPSLLAKDGESVQENQRLTEEDLDTAGARFPNGADNIINALEKVEACITNVFYDQ
jgi:hypothetical protein